MQELHAFCVNVFIIGINPDNKVDAFPTGPDRHSDRDVQQSHLRPLFLLAEFVSLNERVTISGNIGITGCLSLNILPNRVYGAVSTLGNEVQSGSDPLVFPWGQDLAWAAGENFAVRIHVCGRDNLYEVGILKQLQEFFGLLLTGFVRPWRWQHGFRRCRYSGGVACQNLDKTALADRFRAICGTV